MKDGRVVFRPERYTKVYLDWMDAIRPWCVSRQLWWGHRIPVWYCADEHLTVAETEPEACAECGIEGHVMASGAYHDAMVLARKMPVGMLFVPSAGGVSHHPDEYTDPADLDLGVDVLAGTLRRLAEPAS